MIQATEMVWTAKIIKIMMQIVRIGREGVIAVVSTLLTAIMFIT